MDNSVTLFGNGMADLRIGYDVNKEGTEINIPVRTKNLADGINLVVMGATANDRIRVLERRFKPATGATDLKIDPTQPLVSLMQTLRGSRVNLTFPDRKEVGGRLNGIDRFEEDNGGYKVVKSYVSVIGDDGTVRSFLTTDVGTVRFTDKDVQAAITRAMDAAFANIRPDSSLITLRLQSAGDTGRAVVGMTIPVAQWNIAYQLRRTGDVWRLTGSAIVHNTTDQPWENAVIRCVTGIPFTGDLEDLVTPKVPERAKIKINSDYAPGGTEAGRGHLTPDQITRLRGANAKASSRQMMGCAPAAAGGPEGLESLRSFAPDDYAPGDVAEGGSAEATETGDFTVLTPTDGDGRPARQTVPPNSSATIDVIGTDLKDCRAELYYCTEKDELRSGRPQMALRLTNGLPHSLQRGPCNIYVREASGFDLFQGTAVLPGLKPGETRYVLHGEDTGVDVKREGGGNTRDYSRILIEGGVIVTETAVRAETVYTVRSVKAEPCEVVIEHNRVLGYTGATLDGSVPAEEDTATGGRYRLRVAARGEATLKVAEAYTEKSKVEFTDLGWIKGTVIDRQHPAGKLVKELEPALDIQKKIDAKNEEYQKYGQEESALEKSQTDLRKNIESTKGTAHATEFQAELVTNDKRLKEIRTKLIPGLTADINQLRIDLRAALRKVSLTWAAKEVAAK